MSKVTFTDEQIEAVLQALERQAFADFYTGPFEDFITGDYAHRNKMSHDECRESMKKEIRKLVERGY